MGYFCGASKRKVNNDLEVVCATQLAGRRIIPVNRSCLLMQRWGSIPLAPFSVLLARDKYHSRSAWSAYQTVTQLYAPGARVAECQAVLRARL